MIASIPAFSDAWSVGPRKLYPLSMEKEPQECKQADLCCTGCPGYCLLERMLAVPDLASVGSRLRLQHCTKASCMHPHCCAKAPLKPGGAPAAGRWACRSTAEVARCKCTRYLFSVLSYHFMKSPRQILEHCQWWHRSPRAASEYAHLSLLDLLLLQLLI